MSNDSTAYAIKRFGKQSCSWKGTNGRKDSREGRKERLEGGRKEEERRQKKEWMGVIMEGKSKKWKRVGEWKM